MTRSSIIKRAALIAAAAVIIAMLASYAITYISRHKADPLEGVWMSSREGVDYGMSFKNGKFSTVVNAQSFARMNYKIMSTAESDGKLSVTVLQYDDKNSYNAVYEIEGKTLIYDGSEYIKQ